MSEVMELNKQSHAEEMASPARRETGREQGQRLWAQQEESVTQTRTASQEEQGGRGHRSTILLTLPHLL